jgi:hypothetical protein
MALRRKRNSRHSSLISSAVSFGGPASMSHIATAYEYQCLGRPLADFSGTGKVADSGGQEQMLIPLSFR